MIFLDSDQTVLLHCCNYIKTWLRGRFIIRVIGARTTLELAAHFERIRDRATPPNT